MSEEPRVEWHKAPDFAEVAEALGVNTTQIMAVHNPTGGTLLVLFTPTADETLIYSTQVRRGQDGILFESGQRRAHPEMWEQIKRQIEEGR